MPLFLQVNRHTHLMNSIRIDSATDEYSPLDESVAVEPIEGTNDWVILNVYYMNYKKQSKTVYKVKFYFNSNKQPEILNKEEC